MANPIMKYFEYAHLPEHLQAVSKPFGDMAVQMNDQLPDGAEKARACGSCSKQKTAWSGRRLDETAIPRQPTRP